MESTSRGGSRIWQKRGEGAVTCTAGLAALCFKPPSPHTGAGRPCHGSLQGLYKVLRASKNPSAPICAQRHILSFPCSPLLVYLLSGDGGSFRATPTCPASLCRDSDSGNRVVGFPCPVQYSRSRHRNGNHLHNLCHCCFCCPC